jgi:hypothetical protein
MSLLDRTVNRLMTPPFAVSLAVEVIAVVVVAWKGSVALALVCVLAVVALVAIAFLTEVYFDEQDEAAKVTPELNTVHIRGSRWTYFNEENPLEKYLPHREDRIVHLKPDMAILDVTKGTITQAVPVRWEPDTKEIKAYVDYFLLPSGDPRATFLTDLSKLLDLAPTATALDWLNANYAAHYGIKFLSVGFPPDPAKPVPPPKDTRSKAELELDRLFAGVKTAAQARQKWIEMTKNPDFAEALADDDLGPKLEGKYQDIVTRIAEGDV